MEHRRDRNAALAADTLTAVRLFAAVPVFVATARGAISIAAFLLVTAWWTDFFDGRLARRSARVTRLGAWDPLADAAIGTALLTGSVASGTVALLPWGVLGTLLLVAFVAHRNLAWCMLLQALAYEEFLGQLLREQSVWLLPLAATVVTMLVANRRRFFGELLPSFFAGIGAPRIASAHAWDRWR